MLFTVIVTDKNDKTDNIRSEVYYQVSNKIKCIDILKTYRSSRYNPAVFEYEGYSLFNLLNLQVHLLARDNIIRLDVQ